MKKVLHTLIGAVLVAGMLSSSAQAATGGAYNSAPGKSMTVTSANTWYTYNFPIRAGAIIPSDNAIISIIYYEYALGQVNVGNKGTLNVQLCQGSTANCTDISAAQSGSTTAFKGKSVYTPFFLYYQVKSNKATGIINGTGNTQITVNYDIPQ
ncbi:flagellar protein FlhE [Pantoea agglomerans]|uniref:flagellar protein FlhE n=1 Tax=Enterobacter agglomerans TaxID=549 RepID=UPI0013E94F94|nr:flagellar protein FlhE [Pantoea agglomerans]